MSALLTFLRPTWIKLLFLVKWILFIGYSHAQGRLGSSHVVIVALYPLAFYYLLGCAMVAWSQRARMIARGSALIAIGVALAALDQGVKLVVATWVPRDGALPILPGWLHLSHVLNTHGTWLARELQPHSVGALMAVQWGIIAAVLLFLVVGHRYYVRAQRQSLWTDAAFLGVFSADISWACDMALRGGILDFIGLPGLVTADLKDIFLTIGSVSFVVETLEHRRFWWQWKPGGSARGPADPTHGPARTDRAGPRARRSPTSRTSARSSTRCSTPPSCSPRC